MEECREMVQLIFKALLYAAEKHKNQRRKDVEASPYINHPINVSYYLSRYCRDLDLNVLVAAILHDTIEDTNTTPEEIESAFGKDVLQLVEEVTDDKNLPRDERKRLQIKTAGQISYGAKQIRLADKISNVTDLLHAPPSGWSQQKKVDYLNWTEEVVNQVRGTDTRLESIYEERLNEAREKLM